MKRIEDDGAHIMIKPKHRAAINQFIDLNQVENEEILRASLDIEDDEEE